MTTPEIIPPMPFGKALDNAEEAELLRRFMRGDGQWLNSLDAVDKLLQSCQRVQNKFGAADGTAEAHEDVRKNIRRLIRRAERVTAALHLLEADDYNAFYIQVNDPTQRPAP